jgi:glycosyltransferase involved in cell wall biosynthesis
LSDRLRVGIDGRSFTSPAAGVRRYVSGLVAALQSVDPRLELIALGGSRSDVPSNLDQVAEPWHPPTNVGWTTVGLPRAAAAAGVDVIHSPAYTTPPWSAIPRVVTIHDVSYERHPEWYPYQRDGLRRAFYRIGARAAAYVLTDSEFSAQEIMAAYAIPRERITVAPLGVSDRFSMSASSGELPAGISRPFLLHVGDLHERRNLHIVVEAMLDLKARDQLSPVTLVLAGVDRGLGDRLRARLQNDAPELVVCLDEVSDAQLVTLYRQAVALVYPSRYEGFGLPVLEAMACGTPVIASTAASIPEVLGDAGILVDPDDLQGWASAIYAILDRLELREKMRMAGLLRAKTFTWARTATITLDVYRRAAGRREA